jgi:hypothetical protein
MKYALLLMVVLIGVPVYAQDDLGARSVWEGTATDTFRVMDGSKKMCFPIRESFELLDLKMKFPDLQDEIKALKARIVVKEEINKNLENQNLLLQEQVVVLETDNKSLHEKMEDGDSFFKSPYFWTPVGVVLGIALTLGVMYAIKPELSD